MSEDINKTNDERIAEEVYEKNVNPDHIMDFEEKGRIVGYCVSKPNSKGCFNINNIRSQWKKLWLADVSVAEFENLCGGIQKQFVEEYIPKQSKKESRQYYKNKIFLVRREHFKELVALLRETGLSDKYFMYDKSSYKNHPLKLGRYVIYEKGQSTKEESKYFGTYEEIKNIIEELAQQE